MNVLLVSQCNKNALTETRRILDQFAERRGDRTWQTPITMEGLITLRKLLKKTARKNTAVACHWIRGKDHSELMWIVGNIGHFNDEGAVPTNTTGRNILRQDDENQWHTAEAISLLAGIAGLFHDFGKANALFQGKLKPTYKGNGSEPIRHEWISLRLFEAFVGDLSDQAWLEQLKAVTPELEKGTLARLVEDKPPHLSNPFASWANRPIAQVVAWLIVTHHRLPEFHGSADGKGSAPHTERIDTWLEGPKFNASWNSPQVFYTDWKPKDWAAIRKFPHGTPISSRTWCEKAHSLGKRALNHKKLQEHDWMADRFTSHLARLVLMLADHSYSAAEPVVQWQDKRYKAYANTDRDTRELKQHLDEHNIGVGHNAVLMAKRLPGLRKQLPAITRMKALKKRVTISRFRWQDKAYDLSKSVSDRSRDQGFFGINMASTGCGKTFANARVMYGLANEREGCRFNVALGLRTLTLQTGDAFRERLHLDAEDLAVLIGSQAVRTLHEQRTESDQEGVTSFERAGSESAEDLIDHNQHLRYEGTLDDGLLSEWLKRSPRLHQLVSAPVLVSTIDYLIPATEGSRGGKQIAPMLRLLTSDLVLDEPDDFGLEDLPALCRLVNWAGMLGSRVLLSSATLPPALVEALFDAYAAGRQAFNKACGEPGNQPAVVCAWFDEFGSVQSDHLVPKSYAAAHQQFVEQRIKQLQKEQAPLRYAQLLPISAGEKDIESVVSAVTEALHPQIFALHNAHHTKAPESTAAVSVGLVRMANINPMIALAKALISKQAPRGYRLHICVYHSQYPLIVRSHIERVIDTVLNRSDEAAIWQQPTIAKALADAPDCQHVFLVLGTPVTEVGRDHDYDWAIAEPSSMRSLIQLAGRIQRHRRKSPETPNLLIMNRNLRGLRGEGVGFTRPGFESKSFPLASHCLDDILQPSQYQHISAVPRIQENTKLDHKQNLVDLEHTQLNVRLFGHPLEPIHAALWWRHNPTWCAELQRRTRFRASGPQQCFALCQEDEGDELEFHEVRQDGLPVAQANRFERVELDFADGVFPWVDINPQQLIEEMAEREDMPINYCSLRYGELRLRELGAFDRWYYHDFLGVFGSP